MPATVSCKLETLREQMDGIFRSPLVKRKHAEVADSVADVVSAPDSPCARESLFETRVRASVVTGLHREQSVVVQDVAERLIRTDIAEDGGTRGGEGSGRGVITGNAGDD